MSLKLITQTNRLVAAIAAGVVAVVARVSRVEVSDVCAVLRALLTRPQGEAGFWKT